MTRRSLAAALTCAALITTVASAQERERAPERERSRERSEWRGPEVRAFTLNRARIGISVQTRADEESDRLGAKIVSVMEGGPADDAGLKAGDIITRFGSTNLGGVKPEGDDVDENASGPGLKLVELAQELDEGDTVRVEYRRDGASRTATIVAEELGPDVTFRRMMPNMVLPKMEGPNSFQYFGNGPDVHVFGDGAPGAFAMTLGRNMGLQLTEMNSDLGEYFGTNEGLLVIRASRDSSIPLRAGDVILSIDGRKPSSVSHALRIITSYDEGETVKVEVMRKRQRTTVQWQVKDREERVRTLRPSQAPFKTRELLPSRDRTRL